MKNITMKEMMATMMANQEKMMERFETLDKRVSALESGRTSSSPKKKATSKTTKAKTTPASKKPTTRKEAVEAYCREKGYSEADRKAYGVACREVREALRQKAEKDGYMSKAAYRKAANKMMADKGFGPMFR